MTTRAKRLAGSSLYLMKARVRRRQGHYCAACKRNPWTELDHVVPIASNGSDEIENLQGLCTFCHRMKTQIQLGQRIRTPFGEDGYPLYDHLPGTLGVVKRVVPEGTVTRKGKKETQGSKGYVAHRAPVPQRASLDHVVIGAHGDVGGDVVGRSVRQSVVGDPLSL